MAPCHSLGVRGMIQLKTVSRNGESIVTFAASFDAKGLAATGSGSRIGSARVMDQLQGPDVRWITLLDTPRVGSGCSKGGWSWHVTIAAAKRKRGRGGLSAGH